MMENMWNAILHSRSSIILERERNDIIFDFCSQFLSLLSIWVKMWYCEKRRFSSTERKIFLFSVDEDELLALKLFKWHDKPLLPWQQGVLFWLYLVMKYNHHQPSLAKKIFFSSSFKSELKSLMATDEHFLFLVTLPFLSNLQMPSHSPRVSPCSTS